MAAIFTHIPSQQAFSEGTAALSLSLPLFLCTEERVSCSLKRLHLYDIVMLKTYSYSK